MSGLDRKHSLLFMSFQLMLLRTLSCCGVRIIFFVVLVSLYGTKLFESHEINLS